ncbi:indolethylamine N-methyltransferase-like [Hyperolius riggenbachi]|uniref:indolethylamine N-methyltransferase-like n=1 Tax=Hyperolius riggenbachi TaxID=752182 RepID=UPI0035A36DC1
MMSSDTQQYKHYHDEAFEAKDLVETHFSHGQVPGIEQCVGFPLGVLHKWASKGVLKGSKLLDLSVGSSVFQLFPVVDIYKEIYMVEFTESNIDHLKLWLDKDEKATDWTFAAKRACQLEGNRQDWKVKEDQVRQAVQQVVKWENHHTTPIDPKLVPEVDCLLVMYILSVCKTKEEFKSCLKNAASRLKVEGQLVLFSPINMSYYKVGQQKFFALTMDEKTLQELVMSVGFIIEEYDLMKNAEKSDILDYSHVCCIRARLAPEA